MTDTPKRIQRKRQKGWRMPEGAVYVGRGTQWGNPFIVGDHINRDNPLFPHVLRTIPGDNARLPWTLITIQSREVAAEAYGWWFIEQIGLMLSARELAGKDLACWCPLDAPCHADFLLELANRSGVSQ